jgi:predicted MPP superfamily phosphohydrolase
VLRPSALLSRRRLLRLGACALAAGGGLLAYALRVEPHWVEVVRRPLPVEHLPPALEGQVLVQLSDLHVGPQVADDFLLGAFELARAIEPAFVAVTGDFMTCRRDEEVAHALRVLEDLPRGRLGTFAVLGNHDYGVKASLPKVADRLGAGLAGLGVRLLRNERATAAGLTFVGLDDLWADRCRPEEALAGLRADEPRVALCHNPDAADEPGWGDYRGWVLCGHTHGGQCKPPLLPPPCLPVRNRRYVAGEVDLGDGRRLYINRALGHILRARFNVRPEITAFTLTRA